MPPLSRAGGRKRPSVMLSTPPLTAIARCVMAGETLASAGFGAHRLGRRPQPAASAAGAPRGCRPTRSSLSALVVVPPPRSTVLTPTDAVGLGPREPAGQHDPAARPPAQPDRRGFLESSARRPRRAGVRPDQQAKRLHQAALLALDLADGEVEHALDRAQPIGGDARSPRRSCRRSRSSGLT